jgi:hypothetical protein
MGKAKGQFQPLLEQAIDSVARVALATPDSDPFPIMGTLLLTLKC